MIDTYLVCCMGMIDSEGVPGYSLGYVSNVSYGLFYNKAINIEFN